MRTRLGLAALFTVALTSACSKASVNPSSLEYSDANHEDSRGPVELPRIPTGPLHEPANFVGAPPATSGYTAKALTAAQTVKARILVIAAESTETTLPAIRQALDYFGTPYDVWVAKDNPGQFTADDLATGSVGKYQGIILTTSNLSYFDASVLPSGAYVSAFTTPEWQVLWSYESAFSVRQVTWYTVPTADYGFGPQPPPANPADPPNPTFVDTTTTPLTITLTADGKNVFPDLAGTLVIKNAYTYLAPPLDGATTVLASDAAGNAIAVVKNYLDGRQNLAVTAASAPFLTHSIALSFGMVRWVTRGLLLGERHVYLSTQSDDEFISNDRFSRSGGNFRLTGNDLTQLDAWQTTFQDAKSADSVTKNFKVDLAFNGSGTTGIYTPDDLTPKAKELQAKFKWISHTYSHPYLETPLTPYCVDYNCVTGELQKNLDVAATMGFATFSKINLVTPNITGLDNPEAMRAMLDIGVRYVVSDTSIADPAKGHVGTNPSPNTGRFNALQPAILEIPRHPVNLFYNVSTPTEWATEYNSIYGPTGTTPHWDHNLTYAEILDFESNVLLAYLAMNDIDPLMFHQSNLRDYPGSSPVNASVAHNSLLGDLLDATVAKYKAIFKLPIMSPTMDALGERVKARMAYNAAGVAATISADAITLTAEKSVYVPVTGLQTQGNESYGGDNISYIYVRAGAPVVIPLTGNPAPPPGPSEEPAAPVGGTDGGVTEDPGTPAPPATTGTVASVKATKKSSGCSTGGSLGYLAIAAAAALLARRKRSASSV